MNFLEYFRLAIDTRAPWCAPWVSADGRPVTRRPFDAEGGFRDVWAHGPAARGRAVLAGFARARRLAV